MKKVIKYIRYHVITDVHGSSEYQTPYTNKERLQDVQRLKDKGFVYNPHSHSWEVTYNDYGTTQKHAVRYFKLKYI